MNLNLIEQNKAIHAKGGFNGGSVIQFEKPIRALLQAYDAKSLLDFGCGKGLFYQNQSWNVATTLYDPAVERFAVLPCGPFGAVICVDVLEHLPEDEVAPTLRQLAGLATKFLFLTFCDRPATKFLPDGRNAHLTIKPELWWRRQIRMLNSPVSIFLRNNTTFIDDYPRVA